MAQRVFGFEYGLARMGEGDLGWYRVMGHGGFFGDGCLYQFADGSEPSFETMCRLKARCARMVQDEGYALVLVDPDAEPSKRFRKLKGVKVTNIRILGSK